MKPAWFKQKPSDLLKKSSNGLRPVRALSRMKVSNKLWPVALGLVAAIVAVPLLLSSGSSQSGVPLAQLPPAGALPSLPAIPAVSVTDTPAHSRLTGRSRNPFVQQKLKGTSATGAGTPPSEVSLPAAAPSKGSSSSSPAGPAPNYNNVAPPFNSLSGGNPPKSTPKKSSSTGQTPKTRYYVALAFGLRGGASYRYDNVAALSGFPPAENPPLVFLGTAKGGKLAVFVFSSLAAVTGPGACVPSLSKCADLELKVGQQETLLSRNADGTLSEYSFKVLSILKHKTKTNGHQQRIKITKLSLGTRRLIARGLKLVAVLGSRSMDLAPDPAPTQGIGMASDAPTPVTHTALQPVTGGPR